MFALYISTVKVCKYVCMHKAVYVCMHIYVCLYVCIYQCTLHGIPSTSSTEITLGFQ